MAVQVLSPQNCLNNPLTSRQASLSPFMKYSPKPNRNPSPNNKPSPNPSSNNKPNPSTNQAIRNQPNCQKPRKSSRSNNTNSVPAISAVQKLTAANNQLTGQVKILKRGKKLTKPGGRHQPSPTLKKKRPCPQKDQEHRFYAGSCTSIFSPPPSSLPMPSFLAKKTVVSNAEDAQGVAIA
uniref:putative uncharacterized protein DDB_G0290521 n=1 Tax=Fragaria vesca subsp. vesca TaxID=101020 RepID=UPI0005CA22E9|nr:PREDICTED: putative uncharacterized protein DDB_G0290521 [Fragaria vesca subsp. vesca]